jgi:hypothetical protein
MTLDKTQYCPSCESLATENEKLREELAEAKKDATLYRFVRDIAEDLAICGWSEEDGEFNNWLPIVNSNLVDEVILAAMEKHHDED